MSSNLFLEIQVAHNCGIGGLQDGLPVVSTVNIPLEDARQLAKEMQPDAGWQKMLELATVPLTCVLCGRNDSFDRRGGVYVVDSSQRTLDVLITPPFDALAELSI